MSALFSKPKMPAPQPLPVAPTEDPEAGKQRENAARQAQVDAAMSGRSTTIVAGKSLLDSDYNETLGGGRKAKRKSASSTDLL